ncbi:MAG TPA: hypothetical protein PKL78_07025 [Anaerolineales bacterium]|nr:hypothetical protein [Anaerolineales bacterium]HUM27752.1 hypothetical protein [Anaerolineales bacterium]
MPNPKDEPTTPNVYADHNSKAIGSFNIGGNVSGTIHIGNNIFSMLHNLTRAEWIQYIGAALLIRQCVPICQLSQKQH